MSYLHAMADVFKQLHIIKDLLNGRLKRQGCYVTMSRHPAGYSQPMYVTFYLNFHTAIAGQRWVRSESIDEANLYDTDAVVEMVMAQLNEAYVRLRGD